MAFDLVRRAERDLFDALPLFQDYKQVSTLCYMFMCIQRGYDPNHMFRNTDEMIPKPMRDIADLLYIPIYSMLEAFCKVLQPSRAPIYRPGHYGIYDPNVDRSQLDDRERF